MIYIYNLYLYFFNDYLQFIFKIILKLNIQFKRVILI